MSNRGNEYSSTDSVVSDSGEYVRQISNNSSMDRILEMMMMMMKQQLDESKQRDVMFMEMLKKLDSKQESKPINTSKKTRSSRFQRDKLKFDKEKLKLERERLEFDKRVHDDNEKRLDYTLEESVIDSKLKDIEPTEFEANSLARFIANYSERYVELSDEYEPIDNYFRRRFTLSISPDQANNPHFIPYDNPIAYIMRNFLIITPYVWDHLFDNSDRIEIRQRTIKTEPRRSSQLAVIIEREYNGMSPDEYYNMTVASASIEPPVISTTKNRELSNATRLLLAENIRIPKDPNLLIGPNSILYKGIVGMNELPDQSMSYTQYKFFKGITSCYAVNIRSHPDVKNDVDMSNYMRSVIVKMCTYLSKISNISEDSIAVNIYCNYVLTGNTKTRRVPIYKGLYNLVIQSDLFIHTVLYDNLLSIGSDPDSQSLNYIINPYYFEIVTINVIAGGNYQDNINNLNSTIELNREGVVRLGWAVLYNFKSKNYGCFIKILSVVMSKIDPTFLSRIRGNDRIVKINYLTFWKEINAELNLPNPVTHPEPTNLNRAEIYTNHLKLSLTVYDIDGIVLLKSTRITDELHHLRVVLHNDHYLLVREILTNDYVGEGIHFDTRLLKNNKKKSYHVDLLPVYYDFETVYDEALGSDNSIQPYSVSWLIGTPCEYLHDSEYDGRNPEFVCSDLEYTSEHIISDMLTNIVDTVLSNFPYHMRNRGDYIDINGRIVEVKVTMIAYNGSGFDHHILFKYLVMLGYKILTQPSGGKLSNFKVLLHSSTSKDNILDVLWVTLSVWDPYLFLNRSLSDVTTSFKLQHLKGSLDHDEVQNAYADGKLQDYIGKHRDEIERYNIDDVKIIAELCPIISKTFYDMTDLKTLADSKSNAFTKGLNIVDYPTLPSLCFKFFMSLFYDSILMKKYPNSNNIKHHLNNIARSKSHMRDVILKPATIEINDIIRSTIVAGRVQGSIGVFGEKDPATLGENIRRSKFLQPSRNLAKVIYYMVDVVSLYPTVMSNESYPIGEEKLIHSNKQVISEYKNRDRIGFYHVVIDYSNYKNKYTIVPFRDRDGRLHWNIDNVTNQNTKGWYPDVVIRLLIRNGCKAKHTPDIFNRGLYAITWQKSSKGTIFKLYIEIFGDIKRKEDKLKNENSPEYNPINREMSKMCMNSLSGKFAQKHYETSTRYYSDKQASEFLRVIEKAKDKDKLHLLEYYPLGDNMMVLKKPKDVISIHYPHIFSFITSYARCYMLETMFKNGTVYYTDTDSGIVSSRTLKKMKNMNLPYDRTKPLIADNDNKLFGMYEIEGKFDELWILAPKSYLCKYKGEVIKWRLKGISSNDSFLYVDESNKSLHNTFATVGDNITQFFYQARKFGEMIITSRNIYKSVENSTVRSIKLEKKIIFPIDNSDYTYIKHQHDDDIEVTIDVKSELNNIDFEQ